MKYEFGYKFGDVLTYTSPTDNKLKTPCVFVRNDQGKAVILLSYAEWVARVSYSSLSKGEESTDYEEGYSEGYRAGVKDVKERVTRWVSGIF